MARLATFGVGVLLAWAAFFGGWMSGWWLIPPLGVFVGLVVRHDRVLLARDRVSRAVAWYDHGLARLQDTWSGTGPAGDRFSDAEHLFASDLDLFGQGSLFQLLSTAKTRTGEDTLAAWLKTPAERDEVVARQDAAKDLRPRVDLREQLATASAELRISVHPEQLVGWATDETRLHGVWPRLAAVGLTALTIGVLTGWFMGTVTTGVLFVVLLLGVTFQLRFQSRTTAVMHAADGPSRELIVIGAVGAVLRRESYTAPRLTTLCASLGTEDTAVGTVALGLRRLVELHDWQHNLIFRPLAAVLFWELHCAFAVETWRQQNGPRVSRWLRTVGTFEALAALGTYAYEHPEDPFPELIESDGPSQYHADSLTHPLLPASRAVTNGVTLGDVSRVFIVSGSNMSGKTTLLRSIGVSAVMALMGAPVRAQSLRLSPMTLGATLRIEDSLQAGRSRFYAETLRLSHILATAREGPTLFLFDELFHGTNSHDRLEGARGLIRSLLDLDAIGLVTTHDLALAAIADPLAPVVQNVHFDDHLVGDELRFDFCLKPGPVTRSNALAIMRAVGLDIVAPDRPRMANVTFPPESSEPPSDAVP